MSPWQLGKKETEKKHSLAVWAGQPNSLSCRTLGFPQATLLRWGWMEVPHWWRGSALSLSWLAMGSRHIAQDIKCTSRWISEWLHMFMQNENVAYQYQSIKTVAYQIIYILNIPCWQDTTINTPKPLTLISSVSFSMYLAWKCREGSWDFITWCPFYQMGFLTSQWTQKPSLSVILTSYPLLGDVFKHLSRTWNYPVSQATAIRIGEI